MHRLLKSPPGDAAAFDTIGSPRLPPGVGPQQAIPATMLSFCFSPSPYSPFTRTKSLACVACLVAVVLCLVGGVFGDDTERSRVLKCESAMHWETETDSTGRVCADGALGSLDPDSPVLNTPPPLNVVVAGMPRSMSTWLFNALRLLMAEADPNLVAGWHVDLKGFVESHLTKKGQTHAACCGKDSPEVRPATCGNDTAPFSLLKQLDSSLLVKIHRPGEWSSFSGTNLTADAGVHAVFVSHRDLPDVVRSLRLQGNWSRFLSNEDLASPRFCYGPLPKGRSFSEADWRTPATWPVVARTWLQCYNALHRISDPSLFVAVRYDDMRHNPLATLRHLADALVRASEHGRGLGPYRRTQDPSGPAWSFSDELLQRVHVKLRQLKTPRCSPGHIELHPVTHLHRGHAHPPEVSDVERQGMDSIKADEHCAEWARSMGYGT